MKHEAMARALTQLDDALIAEAEACAPRRRRVLPRMLALAACLALAVTAALTLARPAPETDLLIGGTLLADAPIPIDRPAPLALDPAQAAQPLAVSLAFEGGADGPLEVSVSDGVLDSPLNAAPRALSSRAVSGGEMLTWTIEAPDERAVYTLFLGGKAAAALRYDAANACWIAEKP